jgi:uncharacterized membrane protein
MKINNKGTKSEGMSFTVSGIIMLLITAITTYNHWILMAISGFCGLYCLIYGLRILKVYNNYKKDESNGK